MAKYKVVFHWSDGTEDEDDNYGMYYDSEADAEEAGDYGLSCRREGAEIMEMSNPGDYPLDEEDFDDDSYEVVEVF